MPPKGKSSSASASASASGAQSASQASSSTSTARASASSKKPIVKNGNASSSLANLAAASTAAPPLFPPGYKTPLSLLSERCTKASFLPPTVTAHLLPSKLYTASITLRRIVPNSKSGETEQIVLKPPKGPSEIAVEKMTTLEARHWAAVYAIFRFGNGLRLNIQLPPQTRDYWAALEAYKASSSPSEAWLWSPTPFEASAARVSTPQASTSTNNSTPSSSRNSTPIPPNPSQPPVLSPRWLSAPEVRMPTHLRDLVETVLITSSKPSDDDYLPPTLLLSALNSTETTTYNTLTKIGFRSGQTLSALSFMRLPLSSSEFRKSLSNLSLIQASLTFLHLHTPENDLPLSLRNGKPPDATARIVDTHDGIEGLARDWWISKVESETGFLAGLLRDVLLKFSTENPGFGVGGKMFGQVVRRLVRKLIGDDDDISQEAGEVELDGWRERKRDEVELLRGVFGERFQKIKLDEDGGVLGRSGCEDGGEELFQVTIPTSTADEISLRILFDPSYSYPSPCIPPTIYVHSPTLPSYITLHLTSLVSTLLFAPDGDCAALVTQGDGGVIGELIDLLEGVWEEVVKNPPSARSVLEKLYRKKDDGSSKIVQIGIKKDDRFSKGAKRFKRIPTRQEQEEMKAGFEKLQERKDYSKMKEGRMALPAWAMKDKLVELVERNRVVICSGETGSGKTTQVPTFILDNAISKLQGMSTTILITQPRRVSAIGVATRVAAERLEDIKSAPNGSNVVGYAIRGERKAGRNCRMLFCTTGVVLARLARGGDPDLEGVSHVFVDEVHERSVDSDFLLLELRDLLKRNLKIKVILMSATINQKQFSDYFGGAPCIEIPGYTHPVQDHYLEEILPHLPFYQPSAKPVRKATQAQLDHMRSTFVARGVTNDRTLQALEILTRSERIDYALVGQTAAYCLARARDAPEGGVLVFMPGVAEIRQAVDAIRAATKGEKIEAFPLHANLSSEEQTAVFRPVREGYRKVVVATNVAETSITIDGIVYVIDCGRVKENTFDPETGVVKLVETWTSKASSKQRRGRAGRTRPGECFKLFSHYTEETVMASHPTPEIVRIPLEMLCLQIKAMRADEDVLTFLGKALDPPDVRAIQSAWATLKLLGAIYDEGGTAARLTPLGAHLAMIPVDLRLGKMLILAAIFRCLDPILTVVALLSSKPFFLSPLDKREEAKKARSMFYHSRSDLLSDARAFDACLAAQNRSNGALRSFAEDNFISLSAFRDILNLRNEYLIALSDVGFIPFRASPTDPGFNENASHENLLKAIIFAGTGRLVKVKLPPPTYDKGLSGAIERDRESKEVRFFEKDGRVFLHPGSLLFTETRFATSFPLFTYFQKHVTTKPFLRDATEVPLYGLLLFGPKIRIDEHQRGLELGDDGWVVLRAWPRIGVLVNSLRALFSADLEANIEEPSWQGPTSPVVKAMLALLERDGGLH